MSNCLSCISFLGESLLKMKKFADNARKKAAIADVEAAFPASCFFN